MVDAVTPLWIDRSDGNGPVQNPMLTQDDFNTGIAAAQAQNLDALWAAATRYEESYISGSAPRLVEWGVVKGLPKSVAIDGWIQSIWALYKQRKPLVTYQWDDSLYDFTSCGPMPYTISDIEAELGL